MDTLHRKDISGADIGLLSKFCIALMLLEGDNGRLPWVIGETVMLLPVWYRSASVWRLSNYKEFRREAIGIEVINFRRICRYIRVSESQMIDILFRMSMVSVVKGQSRRDNPKFKMIFRGVPVSLLGSVEEAEMFGFVIERRRADGNFRKR